MQYNVISEGTIYIAESFEEANDIMDRIPFEIECELIISGYSPITRDEAIFFADNCKMEEEILKMINKGYTPEQALKEWDILPKFNDRILL